MNIKEKFKSIIYILKNAIARFPVSIISILIYTTFSAIIIDTDIIEYDIYANISSFIIYFSIGAFFVESFFNKKDKKAIILYTIFAIISLILVIIQNMDSLTEHNYIFLAKLIVCYLSTLIILGVYFLYKKSGKEFKEYILKFFVNFDKASITYFILAIGVAIVSAIFVYLILAQDLHFLS